MSSAVRAKQVLHGRIFLALGSTRLKCAARRLGGLFSPHDVVCQITTPSVNRRASFWEPLDHSRDVSVLHKLNYCSAIRHENARAMAPCAQTDAFQRCSALRLTC
jgi:hypothetical protein